MFPNNYSLHNVPITKKLMDSVKSSSERYKAYLMDSVKSPSERYKAYLMDSVKSPSERYKGYLEK